MDVRMSGFQDRITVLEAQKRIAERSQRFGPESVHLQSAAGRVLASDVVAGVSIPPFDRSAMDGFALCAAETFGATPYNPLTFQVVGVSLPGKPCPQEVKPGQAVRIMTGAPLPAGADAVVPVEWTEGAGQHEVRVTEGVTPGKNVGRVGEDIARGTIVLRQGRVLRPQDVAVLASLGVQPVEVVRSPRVSALVTGNELLPCGSRPEGFRIVDSNSVMLAALVRNSGGTVQGVELLPDDRPAIVSALERSTADVILISGGSSVGEEDHAPNVLAEMGEVIFHGVALRPAGPAGFGVLTNPTRLVFLMPGNPVSSLCAYDLFAGPAVRVLGGRSPELPHRIRTLPLGEKIASAVGRVDYVRVKVEHDRVFPLAISGASILSSTTRADGFVLIPHDSEGAPTGESVRVHLYD
jgi:molybdopterin molybdotransferase